MRKFASAAAFLFCAFLGGAFAQSLGGGAVRKVLAQTVVPQFLAFTQQASGTASSPSGMTYPAFPVNNLWITADNVDGGVNGVHGLNVEMDSVGTSSSGNKAAISAVERISGAIKSGQANATLNFVGVQSLAQADVNIGGTDTSAANSRGAMFGMGINAILSAGATNYLNLTGAEIGLKAVAGSSVNAKSGLSIASLGAGDTVHGTNYEGALSISRQNGGVGWLNGILFSDYNGAQPMDSTGTLIKTQGASTLVGGIDFSSYTFTGAPITMPLMTPSSSSDTCSAGGVKWDTAAIYVCIATNTWKRATLASF